MFGITYGYDLTRKYTSYFGSLFSDISINRQAGTYNTPANTENIETIRVPLAYGPVEKFLARVEGDPKLQKPFAIVLPRLAFELHNVAYDSARKLNRMNKISKKNASNTLMETIGLEVPYNLSYSLYIMVKNVEDGNKIVEQILPYFQPEWTARLNLIPEVGIEKDIPIILNSIKFEDTYEGNFERRRAIIWQLDFTLKGWYYGPITKSGPIKQVIVNFRIPTTNTAAEGIGITDVSEDIKVQPGLTANGQPTSNLSLSIPYADINSTDDWAYIVTLEGVK